MATKFFKNPFGASGTRTAIPDAIQVDGSVSYTEGYTADYQKIKTDPTSKNIERDKMNSLLYEVSNVLLQIQSYGAPDFITSADNGGASFSYAKGARVVLAGVVYESNVAANVTTPPGASWTVVGSAAQYKQVTQLAATVAANALTLTIAPTTLDFRNATVTNGTPNTRTLAANAVLVVPSTATLGTVSAQASRMVALLIDNAGALEAAVVNLAGGTNLDESGVLNTTAISAAANAANVVYSATARTGVPYRVVGFVESTQTVAGTWSTAPSLIAGAGGNVMTAMQGFGFGQTWQNLTGSRSLGTTYYNTTGKAIAVAIYGSINAANASWIGNVQGSGQVISSATYAVSAQVSLYFTVPPGVAYSVTASGGTGTVTQWSEQR